MNFNRYQRQTILKDFGTKAQEKLKDARILVIGAGGLGIPVLTYLNAMGVGTLGIVEHDLIEISNLQRQVLYSEKDVGKSKLDVILERLKQQNTSTSLISFDTFLTKHNALEIISQFDLVIDGSDNFSTRYLINDACVLLKKPFVSGAIQGFEGQLSVFNYNGGPTYRCLFPKMPAQEEIPNCNTNGVLGVIPGIIGNLQALEAVKLITGVGEVLSGKLLLFNGLHHSYQTINFTLIAENTSLSHLQESYEEGCVNCPNINVEDLEKMVLKNDTVQIIDVRSKKEFNHFSLAHLQAKHIPLDELLKRVHELDVHSPIYLLCQSGNRSEIGGRQLLAHHQQLEVYSIRGGLNKFKTLQE